MRKLRLKISFLFIGVLVVAQSHAQEALLSSPEDSLYREDQFYAGLTYNLLTSVPSGVNIRGLSGGIQFGFLRDMPINKRRNVAVAIGAGLAFDQFGQTLFIGEDSNETTVFTVLRDSDITYDRNSFATAVAEVPVEFRWRSSTASSYRFWRVYTGVRVGYAYWFRSTFKQTGNEGGQTDVPEFDRLRLAATFSFGYGGINFYANYSINPFFKNAVTTEGEPVDFKTIKIGLMFYIL